VDEYGKRFINEQVFKEQALNVGNGKIIDKRDYFVFMDKPNVDSLGGVEINTKAEAVNNYFCSFLEQ
jgi:hypothetical protein